jgi:hypothetical protein
MPRVVGNTNFETMFVSGASPEDLLRVIHADAASFHEQRAPFLLY